MFFFEVPGNDLYLLLCQNNQTTLIKAGHPSINTICWPSLSDNMSVLILNAEQPITSMLDSGQLYM